jgi:hypothetical protein
MKFSHAKNRDIGEGFGFKFKTTISPRSIKNWVNKKEEILKLVSENKGQKHLKHNLKFGVIDFKLKEWIWFVETEDLFTMIKF